MNESQTPQQEAVSWITICAVLVGVAFYISADHGSGPFVMFVSGLVYGVFPQLNSLNSPQIPVIAGALGITVVTMVIGLAFVRPLAAWFSQCEISAIDRQTRRLQCNRARIAKSRRDSDRFDVS